MSQRVINKSKGMLGNGDSREMWDEIISHIPSKLLQKHDVKILVVACGQATEAKALISRMLDLGRTKDEIRNAIEFNDKFCEHTNYWWKNGFAVYEGDFLTMEFDMKFDVVIGNPPYQDANNDKRMLWNQFLDKSVEVCAKDGYIAMVTPSTWMRGKTNIHNSYRMFEELEVEYAVIYENGDTPFDVGSTVSYHITKNTPKVNKTPVYYARWSTKEKVLAANVDLETEKLWPGTLDAESIKWHKKFMPFEKIVFEKSCEFHNQTLKKKGLVSDTKTKKFPYTHHVSAAITRYTSVQFSRHSEWKVMVPLTSTINKAVVDNNCGHGEDMLTLYVGSKAEANRIKKVFQSKLYRFIGMLYKSGRNQLLQGIFPVIDFSRTWTDEELYEHFKLTKKEIKYIENAVK